MKIRNITIGLIDGLTVPFALAAGLSTIVTSSHTIFVSCIAIIIAYSITMTVGGYMSAQKHEPGNSLSSALTIGISYIAGGLLAAIPFSAIGTPITALKYSAMITLPALFVAGYLESRYNNANALVGGLRVCITGAVAGVAAFAVAGFFR